MKFSKIPNNSIILNNFRCIKLNDDILKLIIEFWYEKWFLLGGSPYENLKIFTMTDEQEKYVRKLKLKISYHPIDLTTFLPKNITIINDYAKVQIEVRKKQIFNFNCSKYSYTGRLLNDFCKEHVEKVKNINPL